MVVSGGHSLEVDTPNHFVFRVSGPVQGVPFSTERFGDGRPAFTAYHRLPGLGGSLTIVAGTPEMDR